jgi:excinuclease ABC subunit A
LLLSNCGGEIFVVGTPEDVAKEKRSYTGQYLKDVRKRPRKEAAE